MHVDGLLEPAQYSLPDGEKQAILTERLRELTLLHRERSNAYRRILTVLEQKPDQISSLTEVPMLPVGLFKTHTLRSIPEQEVFKVLTSSGTTGAAVSRVYLDTAAARVQSRALAGIMTHWLGSVRLPMIVVDARSVLRDRRNVTARAAGIIGMATFGRDHFYALDENMSLDRDGLASWLNKHGTSPVLIFGFTFMVWQHLLKALNPGEVDLQNTILIHSGGWKKLAERAVDNREYKAELERVTGLRRVHNFYGMAEQIGTVFVECEQGFLHAPNAADIIVRDPRTWDVARDGEVGVAQVLSGLPESYPGHSVLTEDLARVEAVDNCPCGRRGKAVSIIGRVPEAEIRGCSDSPDALRRGRGVIVDRLVPEVGVIEIRELLRGLRSAARHEVDPFHDSRIEFSTALSQAIFHHPRSRTFPAMMAVAFWLRRAAVLRLSDRFAALERAGSLRVPRGLVFHVPPTNVDTLFVYSLITSFLVGNLNVVRVSSNRPSEQVTVLCEALRGVLAEDRFAEFSDELAVISYAHEAEPTAEVSQRSGPPSALGGQRDDRPAARNSR